jgi:hypothetical protein
LAAATYGDELEGCVDDALRDLRESQIVDAPTAVRLDYEADDDATSSLFDGTELASVNDDWLSNFGARPLEPMLKRYEFLARRRRQNEHAAQLNAERARAGRKQLAQPLVQQLKRAIPTRIEAKSQEQLWSALRAIAKSAQSYEQWKAFAGEGPAHISLSNRLRSRFEEAAMRIWKEVRGPQA